MNAAFTAILCAGVPFLIIVLIAIVQYRPGGMKKEDQSSNDWLFHDFYLKVYEALFGQRNPADVGSMFGIEVDKYLQSAKATQTTPNLKLLVVHHVYGIAILVLSVFLALFGGIWILLPGVAGFAFFMFYDQYALDRKAENRRTQIEDELPRFLDLLKPELEIGMPIDQAMYLICNELGDDNLLAFEFIAALQGSRMGAEKWDEAIIKVADKYQVDSLTDFVLDVTTAYEKGVSVTKSVEQKAEDTNQSHLLSIRERASKLSNTILLPIICFQFVPMIGFVMYPLVIMIMEGFE